MNCAANEVFMQPQQMDTLNRSRAIINQKPVRRYSALVFLNMHFCYRNKIIMIRLLQKEITPPASSSE